MPKDLIRLIIASGNAGTSGQNFLSHVTGAASGAAMTDYILSAWNITGEPAAEDLYDTGTTFNMFVAFTQASRAHHIKRIGAGKIVVTQTGTIPGGSSVSAVSDVVSADTGSTLDVTAIGGFGTSDTLGGSAWFDGYTDPNLPPGDFAEDARFKASLSGSATGDDLIEWTCVYAPDEGPFNTSLSQIHSTRIRRRLASISDWSIEWHNNSGYTDLHSTAPEFIWSQPAYGDDKTFYLRGRRGGVGDWTNVGAVHFIDPREI